MIVWFGVMCSHWFGFSRSASLLVAAVIAGYVVWPYVDAHELVGRIYDTYHTVRRANVVIAGQSPNSIYEGLTLGLLLGLAWVGLEKLSRPQPRGADNTA